MSGMAIKVMRTLAAATLLAALSRVRDTQSVGETVRA